MVAVTGMKEIFNEFFEDKKIKRNARFKYKDLYMSGKFLCSLKVIVSLRI